MLVFVIVYCVLKCHRDPSGDRGAEAFLTFFSLAVPSVPVLPRPFKTGMRVSNIIKGCSLLEL